MSHESFLICNYVPITDLIIQLKKKQKKILKGKKVIK